MKMLDNTNKLFGHPSRAIAAFALGIFSSLTVGTTWACSDAVLRGPPGIIASVRTMDFDVDLGSKFVYVPRGESWQTHAPNNQKGVTWTNRYGFVGLNALDLKTKFADGINEVGLSAATLWLETTQFPTSPDPAIALSIQDIVSWILGQYQSVSEVKAAIQNVVVWGEKSGEINAIPPLHVIVHDATGESLVLEWTRGKPSLYDGSNVKSFQGVMTNDPPYPKQVNNLARYKSLQCIDKPGKAKLRGLDGLPGDSEPTSRFVRLTKLGECASKYANGVNSLFSTPDDAMQAALRVIGRVEIPYGEGWTRGGKMPGDNMPRSYTQWTVARVHGGLDGSGKSTSKIYFRSLKNQSLRLIDLSKLDFSVGGPLKDLPELMIEDGSFNKGQDVTFPYP
ncbi:MAG: linear amide C-N hydrolase [Methylococcaceae bacterium]|nr:linear amide C-N hydrolase [Methylococcaceae bacterium]